MNLLAATYIVCVVAVKPSFGMPAHQSNPERSGRGGPLSTQFPRSGLLSASHVTVPVTVRRIAANVTRTNFVKFVPQLKAPRYSSRRTLSALFDPEDEIIQQDWHDPSLLNSVGLICRSGA